MNDDTVPHNNPNPSLGYILPQQLAASVIPDEYVTAIWVSFRSEGGNTYAAVHVFKDAGECYILLSSKDKDSPDFRKVCTLIAAHMHGQAEGKIYDRRSDICIVIGLKGALTQRVVANMVEKLYARKFKEAMISAVYYHNVPEDLQLLIVAMMQAQDK